MSACKHQNFNMNWRICLSATIPWMCATAPVDQIFTLLSLSLQVKYSSDKTARAHTQSILSLYSAYSVREAVRVLLP